MLGEGRELINKLFKGNNFIESIKILFKGNNFIEIILIFLFL